jgi:hypothetical protein
MSRRLHFRAVALAGALALLLAGAGLVHGHDTPGKVCQVCHVAHVPALEAVAATQVTPVSVVAVHAPAEDFFFHTEPHYSLVPTRAPPALL